MRLIVLRLWQTSWRMVVALLLGLALYGYTVWSHPDKFNQLTGYARTLVEKLASLGVPDQYTVWVNVLNADDKLIFMFFIIIARIILAVATLFAWTLPIMAWKKMRNGGAEGNTDTDLGSENPPFENMSGQSRSGSAQGSGVLSDAGRTSAQQRQNPPIRQAGQAQQLGQSDQIGRQQEKPAAATVRGKPASPPPYKPATAAAIDPATSPHDSLRRRIDNMESVNGASGAAGTLATKLSRIKS